MRMSQLGPTVILAFLMAALATAQLDKPKANEKGPDMEKPKELSRGSVFGGKNLDQWMKDLKSKDPSVRENAIATLKLYGYVAREAIPDLIHLSKDKDVSVRVNAVIAIGMIGLDDQNQQEGVAALVRALGDSQAIIRYQAAVGLSRLGAQAKGAIPHLTSALGSDFSSSGHSWEIRRAAAAALGNVAQDKENGPDARAALALTRAFTDVSAQVRLEAVLSTIVLGPPAKAADKATVQRALVLTLKDSNKHVAIWGHMAQMRMEKVSDEHLAAIAKYLKNDEISVRAHVGRALGTIGRDARSRLPELIDALQVEQEPEAIYWIVWAIMNVEGATPRAMSAVSQLLQHKDKEVRKMAEIALKMLKEYKAAPEPEKPKGK